MLYPGLAEDPPWLESPLDAAVDKFSRDLSAEPVKLSNIIAVSFDAGTPDKAKMVLDRLVGIYIDKHTQVFSAGRADSYAEALWHAARPKPCGSNSSAPASSWIAGIYDIGTQRAALISQRVTAESHICRTSVNAQAMLHGRLAYLKQEIPKTPATIRSTGTDHNEAVDHARQTLTDLHAVEAAMTARYAAGNPDLRRVRGQIAALSPAASGGDRVNVNTQPSPLMQQMRSEIVLGEAQLASRSPRNKPATKAWGRA